MGRFLLLSCALALLLSRPAPADDAKSAARWPQFRGPSGQGVGRQGLKLPTEFGPKKGVLWKTALPAGHSSPCIWDDGIYLTGFDKKANQLETICVNRADGKIRWRRTAPAKNIEKVHEINTPASATPATDGEQVYVYFASYGMLCYGKDGDLKWLRPLDPIPTRGFGSGASPIVAGKLVLLNSASGQQFTLLALDRQSGKRVWEKSRPRGFSTGLWSTPVVRPSKDGDEVIVAGGPAVTAYRLADGALRWQHNGLPAISLSTPAFAGDYIFLTLTNPIGDLEENIVKLPAFAELVKKYDKNKDGKLSADEIPDDMFLFTRGRADKVGDWLKVKEMIPQLDKDKDKAVNGKEWQAMLDMIAKFTSSVQIAAAAIRVDEAPASRERKRPETADGTTHLAWQDTKRVPDVPSPLVYHGLVYLVTERGIVTCRDAKTGKEKYRARLNTRGTCYASPVVGDDKIYMASDGGTLVVFKPGDRFEVLANNDFGEGILATPALVDDRIYVRTERHLYAFR
jgi:outer membrane protein assembly factor BamB